ncbi:MAG: ATP-dependent helicase [Kangiellaceae bacterium]|nr:ATP-dependent helicase [Kangiellaceae bacterium]
MNEIQLNKEQKLAVSFGKTTSNGDFTSEPLLVIAGAGTGKTNTLAHRAAHLLINGVDPEKILLMTFSRRAASELCERTKRIIVQEFKTKKKAISSINFSWMGTFHSVANRLLRRYGKSMGMSSNFTIIDRNDAADLIDVLRHELSLSRSSKRFPKKSTCLNIYSRCINSQQELGKILKEEFPWCEDWLAELKELFRLYSERKIEQMTLDYDDLLLYWYYLADDHLVATNIRKMFDHVLIDEYQDTNLLQAGIIKKIFPDGKGVTVVGDDAQSIYSFRSAEVENILNFPSQFIPTAKVITLKTNYRSTQAILDLSNQLLSESKLGYKKELFSDDRSSFKAQQKPKLVNVEDDLQQAKYIVEKVLEEREMGVDLKQQAVLFRSSHHSDRLEVELLRHDIPFVKYGGLKFLEAAHVKDLLAIAKWMDNPKHKISAFRVLKLIPGIGPSSAMKMLDFLQLHQFKFSALEQFSPPVSALSYWKKLVDLLSESQTENANWPTEMELIKDFYRPLLEQNYDDYYVRSGDIEQIVNLSQQYSSRERFISELTLDPPVATGDLSNESHKDDDFLILSTIHSAKGQEWKNVFILNVADGNFPNEYSTDSPKSIEEERRLLNVAITRAKQNLHLIQPLKYWVPEQKKFGNKHIYGAKSRFLTPSVCHHIESSFYPKVLHQVSEPVVNYETLSNIHNKIRKLW